MTQHTYHCTMHIFAAFWNMHEHASSPGYSTVQQLFVEQISCILGFAAFPCSNEAPRSYMATRGAIGYRAEIQMFCSALYAAR